LRVDVIRVRDWTYETARTLQLTDLSEVGTWYRYTTNNWYPGPRDVYIRFVLVGQEFDVVGIHIDDVSVSCTVG
jgi:hypothetical protein